MLCKRTRKISSGSHQARKYNKEIKREENVERLNDSKIKIGRRGGNTRRLLTGIEKKVPSIHNKENTKITLERKNSKCFHGKGLISI